MSIGDITNKFKQTTPKQFFGVLGIAFLLWIISSMLFCDGSCKKGKTCKKSRIEQGFDATKRAGEGAVGIVKGAGEGAVGIVKGAGEGAVGIVKGAGEVVGNTAKSTRQSIFGRSVGVETNETVATSETAAVETAAVVEETTTEETIVATSNPKAAAAVAATTPAAVNTTESKQVVTEEIIKKKIIVEVEFQTSDGKVLGSKDVAVDEAAAVTTETAVAPKTVEATATTPAKTNSPIDAKIEQLQKEIEKLNAAKTLLEGLN